MDEIREYEDQLAQIRKEIDSGADADDLKELELEIVDLIAELRSNLPRFAKGDEVSTKKLRGKVVDILASKMYKVQPYSAKFQPEGDPILVEESALRSAVFPKPDPVPKAVSISVQEQEQDCTPHDDFEESKSKWKSFAQKNKRGAAKGKAVTTVAKGGVTKQQPQRARSSTKR